MDLRLRGKRALITGASRGIGFAIAEALAAEGAAVGLVAREAAALADAAGRLARNNAAVATVAADVTDTAALRGAVDAIARALEGLDLLVANAGGAAGRGSLVDEDAAAGEFTATFALNAGHAAELIKAGLPYLRDAGGGAVLIVASASGMRPSPGTAYGTAKAAEIHLAAAAALELASYRIRVNALSPGSIMFPGGVWDTIRRQDPEDFAAYEKRGFPFNRLGRLPEVADVATFLLSDRASWITGANVPVDGGQRYLSPRGFA